jgi:DNA/RNA-binding domain of Phe-tRNA-synthetase-like protein
VINIESPIDEVACMLAGAHKTIRDRTDPIQSATHPNIAAWRSLSGLLAQSRRIIPAIESLVKRGAKTLTSLSAGLPYINTLAAIGNSASLRYLVPIGGHAIDLLHADDELVLGYATGQEEFPPLNGGPIEHPLPGEIIFYVMSSSHLPPSDDARGRGGRASSAAAPTRS